MTIAVICVTAVLPLILQVHWRAGGDVESAQPEVAVIERTGVLLSRGVSPYQSWLDHGQLINPVPGKPSWFAMFPYLPLMAAFGLPAAWTHATPAVSDARLSLTLVTFAVSALALRWALVPSATKVRLAQVLLALPTGALFLATGGDDMPVLAFLALGLVGLTRGHWLMAGIGFGVAAALKLTAWPLTLTILSLGAVQRARQIRNTALLGGVIVAATVIPAIAVNPYAFLSNIVAYPFGFTVIPSPAASPLLGHVVSVLTPVPAHLFMAMSLLTCTVVIGIRVRNHWLLDQARAMLLVALLTLIALMTAPHTRAGYLIYPVNFLVWMQLFTHSSHGEFFKLRRR